MKLLLLAAMVGFVGPMAPGLVAVEGESCAAVEEDALACHWRFDAAPNAGRVVWELPVFENRTVATFSVALVGAPDLGWVLTIERKSSEGGWESLTPWVRAARDTTYVHAEGEAVFVLQGGSGVEFRVVFEAGKLAASSGVETPTQLGVGRFDVDYHGKLVPEGVAPRRPAASVTDPQILDEVGEVDDPAWDLRAAWWDDQYLGDGLMDVHVAIEDLRDAGASLRAPSMPDAGSPAVEAVGWRVAWQVGNAAHSVEWILSRDRPGTFQCVLRGPPASEGAAEPIVGYPLCAVDVEEGLLHAVLPISLVGTPLDGAMFEALSARTRMHYLGSVEPVDSASQPRYLFALGGPAVWSVLNPRLDPPRIPWYEDPFAPQNAQITTQVVGSAAASAVAFVYGLATLWRRRRQTAGLLARIDEVTSAGIDRRETLLELGRLEEEFTALFRRHKISEGQYQVVSQRIAMVATRHAMRRQLGLDDGVPGDATATDLRSKA